MSKTELVVAVRPSGESFTLAYDRAGLRQLVGRLGKLQPKLVVVEATGGLQRQVVAALWSAGVTVAAVNPSWVRSYARGSGLLAKTDRIDARLLALFAQREQPAPRPPLDAETQALQELATRRDQLLEMRVAEQQRLQRASAQVRKEVRQHIAYLEAASHRSTMISIRPCGARRPGGASARCCAVFRGWARCSAPRCWPSCRNWARSAAKPPRPPGHPGRTLSGTQQAWKSCAGGSDAQDHRDPQRHAQEQYYLEATMRGCSRKKLNSRRVAHKSTAGMLYSIPEPVDPVGNAPSTQLLNPGVLMIQPAKEWNRRDAEPHQRSDSRSVQARAKF